MSKRYGETVALDGCSFSVPRGRMLGFLGPNGAGKTTAMRCIFGLTQPESGEVRWNGHPVALADKQRFGYLPEQRGLYPRMKVVDQLAYLGRLHGMAKSEAFEAALRWLDRLGLGDRAQSKLEELSHGNQQRAQLASALLHDPELLVLDEPFTGLDPLAVQSLGEVVMEQAARGAAVVFSSHHLDLVEGLCEDVAIIHRGRIVLEGSVASLKANATSRRVEIEIAGADGAWPPDGEGLEVVERRGDRVRLIVDRDTDPQALLALAQAAGAVRHFSFEPPRLSDLFVEAVSQ